MLLTSRHHWPLHEKQYSRRRPLSFGLVRTLSGIWLRVGFCRRGHSVGAEVKEVIWSLSKMIHQPKDCTLHLPRRASRKPRSPLRDCDLLDCDMRTIVFRRRALGSHWSCRMPSRSMRPKPIRSAPYHSHLVLVQSLDTITP